MSKCVAYKDNTKERCNEETKPGRKYCDEHSYRKGASNERSDLAIDNIVDATEAFGKPDESTEIVKSSDNRQALAERQQQTIFDKVQNALDRALEWEEETWAAVRQLPKEQWRYSGAAGEQLRSEIALNERAQDRVIRAVTQIAKLNIDAQAVNVNKMLRELIKNCVTRALTRHGMSNEEINTIRGYLAEEFERAASE